MWIQRTPPNPLHEHECDIPGPIEMSFSSPGDIWECPVCTCRYTKITDYLVRGDDKE